MGKYDYLKSYERQIESIVVAISAIYCFTELILGYRNSWNPWGQIAVLVGLLASGIFFFGKYKTFEVRAHVTCFTSQVMILVYGIECGDFYLILSLFISLCILLGLYGVTQAMIYPFMSYNILVLYYIFIDGQLNWGKYSTDLGMVTRVLQGYLTLFLVIYLVYRYKTSQESMLEMIDALRKSEREKDDFLANVSHEIRTPINTICGISEIMLKNDVPAEMREDMLNIQSAGRNLMSVVGDILDYSELQEGDFEIVEENYYVSSTIYDVINMSMAKKSEKKLELIVDCEADMPSVLVGDEQKIRRVIMNLVNNAIEFTSEGCVSIRFGYRKEEYGINLIVTVKDSGIGMTKESVENLFQKFSQADMGRTRKKGGVGLGLAIAQTIVQRMGGFITVKSELGKGSEFKIVIPQKVYDANPIVELPERSEINAAVYINMEQFRYNEIRDEYGENIQRLVEQLKVKCHVCRNLQELKRWEKREDFNQIFISLLEYQEDPIYFDNLAKRKNVHIILDHYDDAKVQNKNLSKIYKPFFVLSILAALKNAVAENGEKVVEVENHQLYAPEAHILVIDDNRMNIRVVEGLLRAYGVKVSYALSGQEGIDMLASKAYDLILLDHMMPGMDGVETFHHIRKKPDLYYKEIPIIALTANAIAGAREMFIKEGFNDFVAKPVESSVLQRTLKRHIPEGKLKTLDETERIQLQAQQEKGVVKASTSEGELVIGDLDISKGIMYCGNQENYLEILTSQRDSGKDIIEQAQSLYEKADWKNYVIVVHGIKSSMMSIGAVKLSEMAKALEFAGKGEDYDFIRKEHAAMIKEFERVMKILYDCKYLTPAEEKQAVVNKPELSDEDFAQKLVELENVTYEFDANKVIPILDELSKYAYHSKDLKKELKPVYKKVDMFDFMSAYETVAKIKEKA
ncbi:MAG: response regulator [Agathobacter sp.]|nr:response regulator [Agathobacter sp.]